jgi:hypothetical protein
MGCNHSKQLGNPRKPRQASIPPPEFLAPYCYSVCIACGEKIESKTEAQAHEEVFDHWPVVQFCALTIQ